MKDHAVLEAYRYTLPLVRALHLSSGTLLAREGLIVGVRREDGSIGYGEAAPLPGFSRESLADAEQWFAAGMSGDAPPSVRFACDSAREPWTPCRVAVNGLITRAASDPREQARALRDSGYRAIKLKVGGPHSLEEDIAVAHAVAAELRGVCRLRLDANRAWDWDTALAFDSAVAALDIEYIEEPLRDAALLPAFVERATLPLGLDETLLESALFDSLLATGRVRAAVLKPTLLGALDRVRALVDRALEVGATPVFSACFESGVGVGAIAQLAARWAGEDVPCGLDTYRALARDVLKTPLRIENGMLCVDHAPELDAAALEAVAHV